MGKVLDYNQAKDLFDRLQEDFIIFAPKRFAGKGRFSDTDLIDYAAVNSIGEVEWRQKSVYSPKNVIFPVTQTVLKYEVGNITMPENTQEKDILIFLRACDINGIDRLDGIFINNGPYEDVIYKAARDKIKFALIECNESFENCFCVSMNSNLTDNYSIALKFSDKNFIVSVKDGNFKKYLNDKGTEIDYNPGFIQVNETRINLPDTERITPEAFDDPMWNEYDTRCIACGICNTSCVTCSCFTTKDMTSQDDSFQRVRIWTGCHIDRFSDMAGGHSFRRNFGSRMRFKVMHKVNDYKKRFGKNMCVGCGRCDDNCPEYISFANSINKLSRIIDGENEK